MVFSLLFSVLLQVIDRPGEPPRVSRLPAATSSVSGSSHSSSQGTISPAPQPSMATSTIGGFTSPGGEIGGGGRGRGRGRGVPSPSTLPVASPSSPVSQLQQAAPTFSAPASMVTMQAPASTALAGRGRGRGRGGAAPVAQAPSPSPSRGSGFQHRQPHSGSSSSSSASPSPVPFLSMTEREEKFRSNRGRGSPLYVFSSVSL